MTCRREHGNMVNAKLLALKVTLQELHHSVTRADGCAVVEGRSEGEVELVPPAAQVALVHKGGVASLLGAQLLYGATHEVQQLRVPGARELHHAAAPKDLQGLRRRVGHIYVHAD